MGKAGLTLSRRGGSPVEVRAEFGLDNTPGNRPNELINPLPPLEEEERWDAPDAKAGRRLGILIDIQLGYGHLSRVLPGQLFEDRCNHPAGGTPLRPKIDDGQSLAFDDLLLEIGVAHLNDVL